MRREPSPKDSENVFTLPAILMVGFGAGALWIAGAAARERDLELRHTGVAARCEAKRLRSIGGSEARYRIPRTGRDDRRS
jgi:hypothetical protein